MHVIPTTMPPRNRFPALILATALILAWLSLPRPVAAAGKVIPPDTRALADVDAGKTKTATASWWGFDPADSTRPLQAALDSPAEKVIIDDPGAPWIVTPLTLPGDKEIVFQSGVIIEARRGAFLGKSDCLFTANGRRNLTLRGTGATFRMHKADYHQPPYEPAEWRHALSIRGCENTSVEGLTLRDSGGDGIYLGSGPDGAANRNITIRGVTCDGNNRQGISVITAANLLIEDCVFRNTRGTAPQAGIDFEPNHPNELLVNCVLRNCRSEDNAGIAYHLYLGQMHSESPPVSIRFENCSSRGCGRHSTYLGIDNRNGLRSVRGSIDYVGCRFDSDQGGGIHIRGNEADGCRVRFEGCEVIRRDPPDARAAPVTIEAPARMDIDAGNIELKNCLIRDSLSRRPIDLATSPLTRLRNLSGNLRSESPAGTTAYVIDAAQLAKWFPEHQETMRIPRYDFDWSRAVPLSATLPAPAGLPNLRLRQSATMLVQGVAGVPVELLTRVEPVGSHTPPPGKMTLTTPDGQPRILKPVLHDQQVSYQLTPVSSGPLLLRWDGDSRDTLRPVRCSAPLAFSTDGRGLHLFRSTGTLHFAFPAGRNQCAIHVTGAGSAETVKATIADAAGRVIDQQDNIGLPRVFILKRENADSAAVWSIRLERASEGVLEDVTIQTLGIPPLFANSPQGLLVSPR